MHIVKEMEKEQQKDVFSSVASCSVLDSLYTQIFI